MARITLPDGRWLEVRLPTTDEFLLLLDVPDDESRRPFVQRIREVRDIFESACSATSWGGRPGDLQPLQLIELVGPWLDATEDDALPPESGADSETNSLPPSSQATDEG
jgi:hypothetical protein